MPEFTVTFTRSIRDTGTLTVTADSEEDVHRDAAEIPLLRHGSRRWGGRRRDKNGLRKRRGGRADPIAAYTNPRGRG